MELRHFSNTVVGLVRKANEDFIGSLTNQETNRNGDVFVVCDGMGGHVGGAIASKTAVECILQYFKNESHPNPVIALEKAVSFANSQIYKLSQNDPKLAGMGTTCTVLLQKEDNFYVAHVGDSRIYLNTDGKLYRVTKDHSFVQKLVDAGQLKDSEMETHPRKNELTRALGISSEVEVEVSEKPLFVKTGDKFLMCSDGLCGLVNDPTISYVINKDSGPKVVDELISLANNAGGNDNISVDIVEIINSPHLKTVFKDQTNITEDLLETQVLDVSSMKSDNKIMNILKTYKYYILSFLTILILIIIYLIPLDSETKKTIPEIVDEPIVIITEKNNDDLKESDQEDESKKEIIVNKDSKKLENTRPNKKRKNDNSKKENKKPENIKKNIEDKNIIEDQKKKDDNTQKEISIINLAKKLIKNLPFEINLYSFDEKYKIDYDLAEIKKLIEKKTDIDLIKSKTEETQIYWTSLKSEILVNLEKTISDAEIVILSINKLTDSNERRKSYIKDRLDELNNLVADSKKETEIKEAIDKLKRRKKELNRIIESMSPSGFIILDKRYDWDKNCGEEISTLIGEGKMYKYEISFKNLNKKYLTEKKNIIEISKGANFTLKTNEKLNENDHIINKYFSSRNSSGEKWLKKELRDLRQCMEVETLEETYYRKK